jgi:cytoskeletal protein CcmA (bactofilin family)
MQSQDKAQNASVTSYSPLSAAGASVEQATIGRSLVIKGELTGAESLYVDGRIEGSVNVPEHRVTVGRNGIVAANVTAREVVIMGKVKGNIQCTDRLDIRSEGSLTGDVITQRISVEDGAILKGSVQVRSADAKQAPGQGKSVESARPNGETPKPAASAVGA